MFLPWRSFNPLSPRCLCASSASGQLKGRGKLSSRKKSFDLGLARGDGVKAQRMRHVPENGLVFNIAHGFAWEQGARRSPP